MITYTSELKNREGQIRSYFANLAENISRVLEAVDVYAAIHQRRVAALARHVGTKMRLDEDKLFWLYIGGLLHDIGKISIPESILNKTGKLTEEEWLLIRSHTKQGYNILKDIGFTYPVDDIALHHHERVDGSGYPDGIGGDRLSIEVCIIAVCDVVDAMGTHRPYRPARSKEEILQELKNGRGTKYNASVVDAMLEIIESGELDFRYYSQNLSTT